LHNNAVQLYNNLRAVIQKYDGLIVAYSSGIDSTLVLKAAVEVLGDRAVGVTADSASVPRRELADAKRIAAQIGARHIIIGTDEFENADYTSNPANRCYFCKFELYSKLLDVARSEHIAFIANGTNLDDLGDYRPGLEAADEFQVVSPLREAGLRKTDVRELAKYLGLENWDKPAMPCLSSRIPYGTAVNPDNLKKVELAESYLRRLELRDLRVRYFGKTARIETSGDDLAVVEKNIESIIEYFDGLGFEQVELTEFKSGALNAALNLKP
jgi:uncharacterized protein